MAALTLILAACTPPPIKISVSRVGGRQVVSLTQDWGFIVSRKKSPCVDRIELHPATGAHKYFWKLQTPDGHCINLSGFAVGSVPPGFRQVLPFEAKPGGAYLLVVSGIGIGEAQITLR